MWCVGGVSLGGSVTLTLGACVRSVSVCVGGQMWEVLHDNDDDADVTLQGRPDFVALGLKRNPTQDDCSQGDSNQLCSKKKCCKTQTVMPCRLFCKLNRGN